MTVLILLIPLAAVGLWIYAECRMRKAFRIGFGILALAILLCSYHIAGSIAQSYEKIYYQMAVRNLVEIESGDKRKDYDTMLSGYLEASSSDGVHQFHGSSFLRRETNKLKQKYGKTTEPNQAPETTILTVTDRAPSSTLRASEDRVSP
jgi:hypothetical protein